jgi:hypothetical protein
MGLLRFVGNECQATRPFEVKILIIQSFAIIFNFRDQGQSTQRGDQYTSDRSSDEKISENKSPISLGDSGPQSWMCMDERGIFHGSIP